jgi:hypothetical protein
MEARSGRMAINRRRGRLVPKRRDAWSNLQAVNARSPMGSGEATMTNADSHDSDQNSTLQFKKRQPFGQITTTL